ncbi:MAG: hypothetical protein WB681_10120 [Candidatus Cybelea sp.]
MGVDLRPDAYAIFTRARAAVTASRYPDALQYTISVTGVEGRTAQANHYRAFCDLADGAIDVASISEEQAAQPPPIVRGFKFSLTAFVCGGHCETGSATVSKPVGSLPESQDVIGVPILDPTYMFGLRYVTGNTQKLEETAPSSLPIIATVSSRQRDYVVLLADTTVVEGVASYHLLLKPLANPKQNRLRELWIGTNDYLPRKALLAGNFTIAPLVDVPWTVKFTVFDGTAFISSETTDSTLYLKHRRVVRNATITFEQIRSAGDSLIGRPLVEPDATETTLVEPLGD